MITRFRLESEGTSWEDCTRQLSEAIGWLFAMDNSQPSDWKITDSVTWLDGDKYRARIVYKRLEVENAVVS